MIPHTLAALVLAVTSQAGLPDGPWAAHTVDDSSALVQLEWAPIAAALPKSRRHQHNYFSFPVRVLKKSGAVRHFVGSASLSLDVGALHEHCYDIALYLDNKKWEAARHMNRSLDSLLGDVELAIRVRSSYVTNRVLGDLALKLSVHAKHGARKDFEHYRGLWLKAPVVKPGTEIILMPRHSGISVTVDGKDAGWVESSVLGPATMEAYLGERSNLPEFRDRVFSNLGRGMREEVEEPAQVSTVGHAPWWFTALKVILIVAVVSLIITCGWCCCRQFRK